jgi:hypothetical protein
MARLRVPPPETVSLNVTVEPVSVVFAPRTTALPFW